MQSAMKTPVEPWYKHLWPWIIIGMLAISVFLSLMMVNIAVNNQDSLVSDNYYEAGKGINRSLDREHLAQQLKLQAKISFDELTGEVDLRLSGASHPDKLTLNLLSPTLEAQDKHLDLLPSPVEPGRYTGSLDAAVKGRRFVELLGQENGQAWRLFEEEKVAPGGSFVLGDEPLKGDEAERP
ncbi:FixH family protein [Pseudomonas sp. QE6]|uniref:FixH family protein n=1 Tax=Pseudomonas TaxID=286 RepID=UPI0023D8B7A4|nr:FixH family protein [Pseudomonas sp. PSE14]WEJ74184.1 FixH family protein [Pseudomonas sp. PSE14]